MMPLTLPADPHPMALRELAARAELGWIVDRPHHLAFPGATDITFGDLGPILASQPLNNVGDPFIGGHGRNHTKTVEIDVVRRLGALFGGDPATVWGYVTSGASEGNLHAIHAAVTAHPDAVIFASRLSHYSVDKAARIVRAPLVLVDTDPQGRMRLDHLRQELVRFAGRPAAIVATVGTTEQESVDDVAGIAGLCDDLRITDRRIHVDAALSGIPLALLPADQQPPFGFTAGATSLVISGHKFLSTPTPCAVIVYPHRPDPSAGDISYIGTSDTTIAGSRSGHTALLLYWALTGNGGLDHHRARAEQARELAAYTHEQLQIRGWAARWQWPKFTVTLANPGQLSRPWILGVDDHHDTGRILCMPGIHRAWIDEFLTDLDTAHRGRIVVPVPPNARVAS